MSTIIKYAKVLSTPDMILFWLGATIFGIGIYANTVDSDDYIGLIVMLGGWSTMASSLILSLLQRVKKLEEKLKDK